MSNLEFILLLIVLFPHLSICDARTGKEWLRFEGLLVYGVKMFRKDEGL